MTHNMKIKYPFYIPENPFIDSLFHTVGFVSHSVKYVSHTVVFVSHSVKQRICYWRITFFVGRFLFLFRFFCIFVFGINEKN